MQSVIKSKSKLLILHVFIWDVRQEILGAVMLYSESCMITWSSHTVTFQLGGVFLHLSLTQLSEFLQESTLSLRAMNILLGEASQEVDSSPHTTVYIQSPCTFYNIVKQNNSKARLYLFYLYIASSRASVYIFAAAALRLLTL